MMTNYGTLPTCLCFAMDKIKIRYSIVSAQHNLNWSWEGQSNMKKTDPTALISNVPQLKELWNKSIGHLTTCPAPTSQDDAILTHRRNF